MADGNKFLVEKYILLYLYSLASELLSLPELMNSLPSIWVSNQEPTLSDKSTVSAFRDIYCEKSYSPGPSGEGGGDGWSLRGKKL